MANSHLELALQRISEGFNGGLTTQWGDLWSCFWRTVRLLIDVGEPSTLYGDVRVHSLCYFSWLMNKKPALAC